MATACTAVLPLLLLLLACGTVSAEDDPEADPPTPPSDPNSKVLTLDAGNWDEVMADPERLLMVEFYAPWCGHCKNLAPGYERAAEQLSAKFEGRKLLAKIDASNNRPISGKYRVMSYPTLLLFARGIEGEPFEDRNMAVLKGFMAGLVENPSRLEAKRKFHEEKSAAKAALMNMDGPSYDTKLGEMRGLSTLTFLHARFCQPCQQIFDEFAKAAGILAQEGYPVGVLAEIDSGMGGSRGSAPRKFARPCEDCTACEGYPCFKMMDIDEDGVPHHVEIGLQNARVASVFASAIRKRYEKRGITPQAATTAFFQNQIRAAYKEFIPEKVDDVEQLLEKYSGKEQELLESVKKKYDLPTDMTIGAHVVSIEEAKFAKEREEAMAKAKAEAEKADWEATLAKAAGGGDEAGNDDGEEVSHEDMLNAEQKAPKKKKIVIDKDEL